MVSKCCCLFYEIQYLLFNKYLCNSYLMKYSNSLVKYLILPCKLIGCLLSSRTRAVSPGSEAEKIKLSLEGTKTALAKICS